MNRQSAVVLLVVVLIFVAGAVLHVRNPTLSDEKLSTRTPVPPTDTPTPEPSELEDYKSLLFVDETLAELADRYSPQSGEFFQPFFDAYTHTQNGDNLKAIDLLQAFAAQPDAEVRARLWAWNALRSLGVKPSVRAQEVQGLVLEMPVNGAVDTLAVYADGRIRYLTASIFVWEEDDRDNKLLPLTQAVIAAAQPFAGQSEPLERHLPENPAVVRASLLTYSGIYVVEGSYLAALRGNDTLSPLLEAVTALLTKIAEVEERGSEA